MIAMFIFVIRLFIIVMSIVLIVIVMVIIIIAMVIPTDIRGTGHLSRFTSLAISRTCFETLVGCHSDCSEGV